MAQEQSVQGAAEKISGLLNPKQDNQVPEKKEAAPSEQPEKIEQETSKESQSKSEETPKEVATEKTEIEEETQTATEEPELHRVKVSGQELEVTLDELKAGYSRDSDYRQKTHTLGLEKKDLEAQKNSLRQSYDTRLSELNEMITTADSFVRQQQGSKDLQKLYDEAPTSAAKLDYQLRQQNRQIEEMKSKAQDAYTKQYNEYLDIQKQLAAAKIPEYSDPNKADQFRTNMRTTLRTYGFTDSEIGIKEMEASISNASKYGIFDLSNAFVSGNKKRTYKIIESLKSEGMQPTLILWALTKEINNLYKVMEEKSTTRNHGGIM